MQEPEKSKGRNAASDLAFNPGDGFIIKNVPSIEQNIPQQKLLKFLYYFIRTIEIELIWQINVEEIKSPLTDYYTKNTLVFRRHFLYAGYVVFTSYELQDIKNEADITNIGQIYGLECLRYFSSYRFVKTPTFETIIDIYPDKRNQAKFCTFGEFFEDLPYIFWYIVTMDFALYLRIYKYFEIFFKENNSILDTCELHDIKFYYFIINSIKSSDGESPTIQKYYEEWVGKKPLHKTMKHPNIYIKQEPPQNDPDFGPLTLINRGKNGIITSDQFILESVVEWKHQIHPKNQQEDITLSASENRSFKDKSDCNSASESEEQICNNLDRDQSIFNSNQVLEVVHSVDENHESLSTLITTLQKLDQEIYETFLERQKIIESKIAKCHFNEI